MSTWSGHYTLGAAEDQYDGAVSVEAASVRQAVQRAADKIIRALQPAARDVYEISVVLSREDA